jgi:hypothetical protein
MKKVFWTILFCGLWLSASAQFECIDFSDDFETGCTTTPVFDVLLPKIRIYPNPTDYEITVDTEGVEINDIQIFDALGKLIIVEKKAQTVDVSNLISGYYFVIVNKKYKIKFIKI